MKATYIASDNTATNGTALGAADQDVRIFKLIFGLGADAEYATIYDISNPVTGATGNIVTKITQPTAAAGKDYFQVVDFGPDGLPVQSGGNIVTDASQVTVIWDLADESSARN
jgi:hypothetical protein